MSETTVKGFYLPSFKGGYARNASESRYPDLWRGKIGHWCPALGATGDVIQDISRYKVDARFSSAPPLISDWQLSEKGFVLDANNVGGNFKLNMGNNNLSRFDFTTGGYSISGLIKPNDTGLQRRLIEKQAFNADGWRCAVLANDRLQITHFTSGASTVANSNIITGLPKWISFTVAISLAGVATFWINGIDETNDGSINAAVAPTTRDLTIGIDAGSQSYDGLIADVRVYNRVLNYQDHLLLYANPYADLILKQKTARRIF